MVAPVVGQMASWVLATSVAGETVVFAVVPGVSGGVLWLVGLVVLVIAAWELAGLRYIANNKVGVVEKLWSVKGSVPEGGIIALAGEAGYQAEVLRGGLHFGYWRWQFRIHRMPLVSIPQGKIGYVYARDGEALLPSQTLGQVIACNNFQDARGFLGGESRGVDREPLLGPARPAASDPAGRRLRDQCRAVHGDHRRRGLPPGDRWCERAEGHRSGGRTT